MNFCLPDPFYHRMSIQRAQPWGKGSDYFHELNAAFACQAKGYMLQDCEMGLSGAVASPTFPWFPPAVQNGKSLIKTQQDLKRLCLPARRNPRAVRRGYMGCCQPGLRRCDCLGNSLHCCLPQFPHFWDGYNGSMGKGQWNQELKVACQSVKCCCPDMESPLNGVLGACPSTSHLVIFLCSAYGITTSWRLSVDRHKRRSKPWTSLMRWSSTGKQQTAFNSSVHPTDLSAYKVGQGDFICLCQCARVSRTCLILFLSSHYLKSL